MTYVNVNNGMLFHVNGISDNGHVDGKLNGGAKFSISECEFLRNYVRENEFDSTRFLLRSTPVDKKIMNLDFNFLIRMSLNKEGIEDVTDLLDLTMLYDKTGDKKLLPVIAIKCMHDFS